MKAGTLIFAAALLLGCTTTAITACKYVEEARELADYLEVHAEEDWAQKILPVARLISQALDAVCLEGVIAEAYLIRSLEVLKRSVFPAGNNSVTAAAPNIEILCDRLSQPFGDLNPKLNLHAAYAELCKEAANE